MTTTTISGGAYDLDEILSLTIRVNGSILDTITPGPNVIDFGWTTSGTPVISGAYTLSVEMNDAPANDPLTDSIQVTVVGDDPPPTAIALGRMNATAAPDWLLLLLAGVALLLALTGIVVRRRRLVNNKRPRLDT